MSVAVDFGVAQVVDANWGVHAILKKPDIGPHIQIASSLRSSQSQPFKKSLRAKRSNLGRRELGTKRQVSTARWGVDASMPAPEISAVPLQRETHGLGETADREVR